MTPVLKASVLVLVLFVAAMVAWNFYANLHLRP